MSCLLYTSLYDILEGKPVGTRFSAQKGARA